jgi:pyridoxal phosphate enzyme (YggS family)
MTGAKAGDVAGRLSRVRERMAEAAARAGRRPQDVRLIAVSKTFPVEALLEAWEAGQREFGENKVQEGLQKIDRLAEKPIGWHLIGHLQSNKAKKAAERFGWIHAIDSADLLRRVDAAASAAGRSVEVLVQIDLALEPTKHGAPVESVPGILDAAATAKAARLVGLMLLPPLVDDPEQARPWFRRLREMRDAWVDRGTPPEHLGHLSMGMSHDFEVAIEEGATMVRVGSAIFGERAGQP